MLNIYSGTCLQQIPPERYSNYVSFSIPPPVYNFPHSRYLLRNKLTKRVYMTIELSHFGVVQMDVRNEVFSLLPSLDTYIYKNFQFLVHSTCNQKKTGFKRKLISRNCDTFTVWGVRTDIRSKHNSKNTACNWSMCIKHATSSYKLSFINYATKFQHLNRQNHLWFDVADYCLNLTAGLLVWQKERKKWEIGESVIKSKAVSLRRAFFFL